MKLRNKKTGEIVNNNGINFAEGNYKTYNSLAELNEEWEDAPEEPKGFLSISGDATIEHFDRLNENDLCKQIGNYFETQEEAERAVEKLKALKRLKDKGFRFNGGDDAHISYILDTVKWYDELEKDFNLIFGGEE